MVAFGLAGFGVGVVSGGDEGGLVPDSFEPFIARSVLAGGVEGGFGAAVGGSETGVGSEFCSVGEPVGVTPRPVQEGVFAAPRRGPSPVAYDG